MGSSLTGLDDDRVRHWMLIEEFGIDTVGPIEAIGAARDLHSGRRFSPGVLNELKDRLVKGKTQRNRTLMVDVVEHWVGISGRGLFGVKIQVLRHLENKSRVLVEVIQRGRSMAAPQAHGRIQSVVPPKMQGSMGMKGSLTDRNPLSRAFGVVELAGPRKGLEMASGPASEVRDVGVRLCEPCLASEVARSA